MDGNVYRRSGNGWQMVTAPPVKPRRIGVERNGPPWIVSENRRIYRYSHPSSATGTWREMPGRARDIDAGPAGVIYHLGIAEITGGHPAFVWNEQNEDLGVSLNPARFHWEPIGPSDTAATRISVDPQGNPWVVNSFGEIFRRTR